MARSAITRVNLRKAGAFTIEGYDNIIANLNTIMDRTTAENLKDGFLKGAKVIRNAAKLEAPYDKNRKKGHHLKDAVFAAPGDKRQPNAIVGVSRTRKTGKPSAPHGILVHEGTRVRASKGGANRGKVQPNPFFKRAVAKSRTAVAKIITDTMKEAVFGGLK